MHPGLSESLAPLHTPFFPKLVPSHTGLWLPRKEQSSSPSDFAPAHTKTGPAGLNSATSLVPVPPWVSTAQFGSRILSAIHVCHVRVRTHSHRCSLSYLFVSFMTSLVILSFLDQVCSCYLIFLFRLAFEIYHLSDCQDFICLVHLCIPRALSCYLAQNSPSTLVWWMNEWEIPKLRKVCTLPWFRMSAKDFGFLEVTF